MEVHFEEKAKEDINLFDKSGQKQILTKIRVISQAIAECPYTGIGKPEALKHEFSGYWSRRINREHRIIYRYLESEKIIEILPSKAITINPPPNRRKRTYFI